ncbi:MAG: ISAs1 family transposase [Acinetobacter sp.]
MNKKTLLEILEEAPDCRSGNTIRHLLKDILMIGLLCVICNGDTFTDMELFGQTHEEILRRFLALPYGIPSHDVFRNVFGKLEPEELKKGFGAWTESLRDEIQGHTISIDGKTIRGSQNGTIKVKHIVSAFASDVQLVLGQLSVDAKSSEITAIPKLLKLFCVKGNTITIDAMGTQKEIAGIINRKGGDYILALKENQPSLYADIRLYFEQDVLPSSKVALKSEGRYARTCEKGHGRIETRECFLIGDISWLPDKSHWPDLMGAACICSKRILLPAEKESISERFFLFSCSDMSADRLLSLQRGHWAIENQLHWCLNMTLHEDNSRAHMENAAEVLDILRKLALQLMKQGTSVKGSLRNKRLCCGYDVFYAFNVLGVNPISYA